jgi:hypothetical protein
MGQSALTIRALFGDVNKIMQVFLHRHKLLDLNLTALSWMISFFQTLYISPVVSAVAAASRFWFAARACLAF